MSDAPAPSTRCCLLTSAGGAIAVIRVSGPRAVQAVRELFQPVAGRRGPHLDPGQPERLRYGRLVAESETLDEVIACAAPGPGGSSRVELSVHGGLRVIERILMALRARGVVVESDSSRPSSAWPVAHQIDAEVIDAVCQAQTRRVVSFLLGQGSVLPQHLEELARRAERDSAGAMAGLQALLETAGPCRRLVEGADVALIGPPNAGKSTLANRLFGAPRAVVSAQPGTTRDWVAEPTAIRGIPVTVVDTPGASAAATFLEALAVRRGRARWGDADLRLIVLDGSRELPDDFFERYASDLAIPPLLVVANKSDRPRRWSDDLLPPVVGSAALPVSALGGQGLPELEEAIVTQLGLAGWQDDQPGLFTRRQRDSVARILAGDRPNAPDLARRICREVLGAP